MACWCRSPSTRRWGPGIGPGGFVSRLWRWLSGENRALLEAMQTLAATEFHPRVRIIWE